MFQGLLDANFVSKVRYTKWISNVVLVKKALGKQRCVLITWTLTEHSLMIRIPFRIYTSRQTIFLGTSFFSFMDAFQATTRQPCASLKWEKTTFKIEQVNYEYNMMLFDLKNVRAAYRRIMDKVFSEEIGETLDIYIDDTIVKFNKHFYHVFQRV